MQHKILIITGDGGESYEALYATHRFAEEGIPTVVAAPKKGPMHLVIHDFEPGWDTYIERPGYSLDAQITLTEIIVEDYSLYYYWEAGPRNICAIINNYLILYSQFHKQGKWVFAICHGIQILVTAGLADKNCLTAYEHVRSEIEMGGGKYSTQQAIKG